MKIRDLGSWRVGAVRGLVCVACVGMTFLCLPLSTSSATDYSIGSDARSITVDQALHPGQTVTLPDFGIYNQGTKPADYQMAVVALSADGGIDPSWVGFQPEEFSLQPGEMSRITASISVPKTQRLGHTRLCWPAGSQPPMAPGWR